ncbi:MAG TPA: anti-sigma factor, partial [Candidatus Acidoferrales bacterium]|nr:anti-sigma factor [Candidatus Acidoferrales bacterium]
MPPIDEPPRPDSAPARGFTMLIAAAVAAVVAFAVSWASFDSHSSRGAYDASKDVAALTARVVAVQRDLDATGDKLAALRTRITQSTDLTVASLGPDSRVAHLSALPPAPGADGVVAINRAAGTAILHASGLPPTPSDKTYEVWWIGAKQEAVKAGTFE